MMPLLSLVSLLISCSSKQFVIASAIGTKQRESLHYLQITHEYCFPGRAGKWAGLCGIALVCWMQTLSAQTTVTPNYTYLDERGRVYFSELDAIDGIISAKYSLSDFRCLTFDCAHPNTGQFLFYRNTEGDCSPPTHQVVQPWVIDSMQFVVSQACRVIRWSNAQGEFTQIQPPGTLNFFVMRYDASFDAGVVSFPVNVGPETITREFFDCPQSHPTYDPGLRQCLANSAPTATINGPFTGQLGEPLSVSGTGQDPEGQPVALQWSLPGGQPDSASGPDAAVTYFMPGEYAIGLTVSDGTLTARAESRVTIANQVPVFNSQAPQTLTIRQGQQAQVNFAATDADAAVIGPDNQPVDALTYAVSPVSALLSIDSAGQLSVRAAADAEEGEIAVQVNVNDRFGGQAIAAFTIQVIPDNYAPRIVSGVPINASAGQPLTLQIVAYDEDLALGFGETPERLTFDHDLPAWIDYVGEPVAGDAPGRWVLPVSGTPTQEGPAEFRITVTDSRGESGTLDTVLHVVDINPIKALGAAPGCSVSDPIHNGSNPINGATGNKYQRETDYVGSGIFPLVFERHYNSLLNTSYQMAGLPAPSADFGENWTHTYGRRLVIIDATTVHAYRADGLLVSFSRQDGQWQVDSPFPLRLEQSADGWRLTDSNDQRELYNINGRLERLENRAGFGVSFDYNAQGRLQTATDHAGRRLTFDYDAQTGHLSGVLDPAGNAITYGYYNGELRVVHHPDGGRREYDYFMGALAAISAGDGIGRSITLAQFEYDRSGRAVLSTHPERARETYFDYYGPGVTAVTDAQGAVRTWFFDSINGYPLKRQVSGGACESCGATGQVQSILYNEAGLPVQTTEFDGKTTAFEYDTRNHARGLVTRRTEALGTPLERKTEILWHDLWRLPVCRITPQKTTVYAYNRFGQLVNFTDIDTTDPMLFPSGVSLDDCATLTDRADLPERAVRVWTYDYHGNTADKQAGQRKSQTDPLGNTTHFRYEPTTGDLIAIENAVGHVTRLLQYDAHGRPTVLADPNGVFTQILYDAVGRETRIETGEGVLNGQQVIFSRSEATAMDYDALGNLTRVSETDGRYINYDYDTALRLVGIYDAQRHALRFRYDAQGNLTRMTTSAIGMLPFDRHFLYDRYSRLTEIRGARYDHLASYQYAGESRVLLYENDGNGYRTHYQYDVLNRVTGVSDGLGKVADYQYDTDDNLVAVVDANDETARYTLNGFGERVRRESLQTGVTHYDYNSAGRLRQQSNGDSETNTAYDALGRPSLVTHSDAHQTHYIYDEGEFGVGRLSRMEDSVPGGGKVGVAWTYDYRGRVTQRQQTFGDAAFNLDYEYNDEGQLVRITYPSGLTVDYAYDNGQVVDLRVNGELFNSDLGYYPFGRFNRWTQSGPNGPVTRYINRDADGRVTSYPGPEGNIRLEYDAAGNVSRLITAENLSTDFDYDERDRLTVYNTSNTAQSGSVSRQDYQYDANGNRTRLVSQKPDGDVTEQVYRYDQNQYGGLQLVSPTSARPFDYDDRGNISSEGQPFTRANKRYVYDARGYLVQASQFDSPNSAIINYLAVTNGAGQRVYKQFRDGSNVGWEFAVYDDTGLLMGEYESPQSSNAEYIWFQNRPIAVMRGGKLYRIFTDHLDTPRWVTDPEGRVVWTWLSDPFGAAQPNQDADGDGNTFTFNLRFPGQYYDAETGLHYNWNRHYDPQTGRYLQADPIGLAGGLNLYTYAQNNPANYVDRDGLLPDAVVDIGLILYDLYRLTKDNIFGECDNLDTNLAALGADAGGLLAPGVTGLGLGVRAAGVTKSADNLPIPFDGAHATKQLLGTTKTPGGRDINFHAADRMVNPPKGRSQMSPADVDAVLDGATNIRKRSFHPQGNTLTIQNRNLPGKPQVVVDEATGNRVITVINPK